MCDLYPGDDELPGVESCDVDSFLDRFAREANPAMYAGVVAGSVIYTLSPVLTLGKLRPSFLLSKEDRDAHANHMSTTDRYLLRQTTFIVKLVAGLCWGQHPTVRKKMNLEPYPEDPGTFRTS
jgi:hypothetical protein